MPKAVYRVISLFLDLKKPTLKYIKIILEVVYYFL